MKAKVKNMSPIVNALLRHIVPKCNKGLFMKESDLLIINTNALNGLGLRLLKTQSEDEELIKEATDVSLDDIDEVTGKKEEELERKRNKSRLNPAHRNIIHGNIPYSEPITSFHKTVKYQRKIYARYGKVSGVNPGIMWPTKEDLKEIQEYESVAYPFTLQELLSEAQEKKEKRLEVTKEREKQIMENYAALREQKKKLQIKEAEKLATVQAAKEKKDQLLEEVRRHFGYKVNVHDPRFKEMLEKKEKEQKKTAKEAKKKAKEALVLAKLRGLNLIEPAEIKPQTEQEEVKQMKTKEVKDEDTDSDEEEEEVRSRKSKK